MHLICLQVRRDYEDLPETSNSRNEGAGVPDIVVLYHDSYVEIDTRDDVDSNNANQVTS